MSLSAKPDMKVTATEALDYDGRDGEPKRRKTGPLLVAGLTLTGCALVAWLVYGEQILALLHAGGDVPVVRADAGPVKVRPEQPGGMEVPNRDKLVYERLDGSEDTSARVERLLPRPEEPLPRSAIAPAPSGEETPSAPASGSQPTLSDVPDAETVAGAMRPEPAPPPPTSPPETDGGAGAPTRLLPRDAAGAGIAPPPAAAPTPPVEERPVPTQQAASPPATPPAPPETQPSSAAAPPAPKLAPSAANPTETAATAPSAPLGEAYRVQLLAARSQDGAEAEWRRIRSENLDLLGDLALNVTRVDLGTDKGIFYRVRVGPLADEAAAKTLCTRLKQRKQGCLVVRPGG